MIIRENSFEIRPVTPADLQAVLEVYQLCEDFLALGPVATASMQMVLKDIEISKGEGGLFCSLYNAAGKMIGLWTMFQIIIRATPIPPIFRCS